MELMVIARLIVPDSVKDAVTEYYRESLRPVMTEQITGKLDTATILVLELMKDIVVTVGKTQLKYVMTVKITETTDFVTPIVPV
jgi:hypothetical protein